MPTSARPAKAAAPAGGRPSPSRRQRFLAYAVLACGYVLGWAATISTVVADPQAFPASLNSLGPYLLVLTLLAVLYVDGAGYFTLRKLLVWGRVPRWSWGPLAIGMLALSPLLLAVYFLRALCLP